ncbi:hypothetical protein WS67_12080 [Burkholderia singularis]|uniref:Nucleotide modification associated domain-containing protein n=1 Tax=Burkholderia singularis TaxID=1503053 RepID=A0A118DNZ0_9BURK|nr:MULTISPECIES: Nmad5 family putative nucleotide modification protein [Burkholderia]KVE27234.1 hypothetical protein WS67_12080 [Burkholderia singularis]KVE33728.1 hypothetical protein WS68_11175 [Burkholderia sp. TSV86]
MRLTNYARSAFVKSVLDDVPRTDYQEEARIAAQKWAVDHLPPKLRALYKEFDGHFNHEYVRLPGSLSSVRVVIGSTNSSMHAAMQADAPFWARITELAKLSDEQSEARKALRAKVDAAIAACTTVKQAHERLPEFAKYLPPLDATIDRTVTVIAYLVADLTAAGWPKGKKPTAQKAVRK